TLLKSVTLPLRRNSRVLYNATPNLLVPMRYLAATFNGNTVFTFPFSFVIDNGASFHVFNSISSSVMTLSSYINPVSTLFVCDSMYLRRIVTGKFINEVENSYAIDYALSASGYNDS